LTQVIGYIKLKAIYNLDKTIVWFCPLVFAVFMKICGFSSDKFFVYTILNPIMGYQNV